MLEGALNTSQGSINPNTDTQAVVKFDENAGATKGKSTSLGAGASEGTPTPSDAKGSKVPPASSPKDDAYPKGIMVLSYNACPPPQSYHAPNFYPMPHIDSHDPPPKLNKANFGNWQTLMKSRFCSASTQLWRAVKTKFVPKRNIENKNFNNKHSRFSNIKRIPSRVLVVQEEYESSGEDEEENTCRELVVTNIANTSSPTSLFDAPNENLVIKHTCFMAKATEVSSKPKPMPITTP
jgi:hypothetical protein